MFDKPAVRLENRKQIFETFFLENLLLFYDALDKHDLDLM